MILASTVDGRWTPGIGDPTLGGWLTVVIYAIAAFACARTAWRTWPMRMAAIPWWWWATFAVTLAILGINKQLDLQTWFTQTLRDMAKSQGWYDNRRAIGMKVYAVFVGFGLVICGVVLYFARRGGARAWWTVAGMGVLGAFIVLRAASFHHVDKLLGWRVSGFGVNFVMECIGLVMISFGAWARPRTRRVVRAKLVA